MLGKVSLGQSLGPLIPQTAVYKEEELRKNKSRVSLPKSPHIPKTLPVSSPSMALRKTLVFHLSAEPEVAFSDR